MAGKLQLSIVNMNSNDPIEGCSKTENNTIEISYLSLFGISPDISLMSQITAPINSPYTDGLMVHADGRMECPQKLWYGVPIPEFHWDQMIRKIIRGTREIRPKFSLQQALFKKKISY